ncbi:hypothetical protein FRB99_003647 [Tulasnella sp. 403]|nr:hypothetical protein FRB99_003647 [Tulasnella sp. 403]
MSSANTTPEPSLLDPSMQNTVHGSDAHQQSPTPPSAPADLTLSAVASDGQIANPDLSIPSAAPHFGDVGHVDWIIRSCDYAKFGVNSETLMHLSPGFCSLLQASDPSGHVEPFQLSFTCNEPADVLRVILNAVLLRSYQSVESIDLAWSCCNAFDKCGLLPRGRLRLADPFDPERITSSMVAFKAHILAWRLHQFPHAAYAFRYTQNEDMGAYHKIAIGMPRSLRYYQGFVEMDSQCEKAITFILAKLPVDVLCGSCCEQATYLRCRALVKNVLRKPHDSITIATFVDPQEWLKAGITEGCMAGECKMSIQGYQHTFFGILVAAGIKEDSPLTHILQMLELEEKWGKKELGSLDNDE